LKGATIKPRLFVAARAFNPFALPMGLRLLKFEHLKLRARDFLAQLPMDAPAPAPAAPKAATATATAEPSAPKDAPKAPRPTFVGREQELEAMKAHLSSDGGPILVHGPKGVGRRWLVEKAIADSGLERLPDLSFGRGIGADTLLARIASIAEAAENDELGKALQSKNRPSPQALAELAAEALSKAPLAGKVWAIFGVDALLDRRNGSLYREDRLGLVVWRILESTPALRLVMVTDALPRFFREGQGKALRVVNLEGLLGRELHELFDVWHCEGVERDRFGPLHQRTFGHPMSTRALAIQAREDGGDLDALLEAPRLLKAETLWDLEPLMRHFRRRVGALAEEDRKALAAAAHLKEPGTAQDLNAIGVSRNARLTLMAQGLLEQTPVQDDRRYYVHPLVAEHLTFQEAADFETMERLAHALLEEVRGKRTEAGPEGGNPGRGRGRDRGAVIGARPRDDLGAVRLAAAGVKGAGDLEGELVRLAARVCEGEDRLVADHDLRQALGQLGDVDVRNPRVERDELEFLDLVGDPLCHFGAAMADLAGAEMAAGVEQAIALLVEDIGALAADDHLRVAVGVLALQRGEVGEEMADVFPGAITGGGPGPCRRRLGCHH